MLRSVSVGALAAALSFSLCVEGEASAQARHGFRPGHRPHAGHFRPGHHHGWGHRHGGHGGRVVAAGMIGLFAGAALANANRYGPPAAPLPYDQVDPYTQP